MEIAVSCTISSPKLNECINNRTPSRPPCLSKNFLSTSVSVYRCHCSMCIRSIISILDHRTIMLYHSGSVFYHRIQFRSPTTENQPSRKDTNLFLLPYLFQCSRRLPNRINSNILIQVLDEKSTRCISDHLVHQ